MKDLKKQLNRSLLLGLMKSRKSWENGIGPKDMS